MADSLVRSLTLATVVEQQQASRAGDEDGREITEDERAEPW